ncbi:Inosose isomerase [Chlamydia abortus]|uniref:sugar phosphate isomerase/epimerase family protein n=1 Tax=Paenibacillus sp. 32O-W TaxID=1695218 RepID=UPI000A27B430|nr:sugar phosphate isomerase/epimerase family protein [Paenibacillus sp. 32O-W]SHE14224.1 Inosose isomerase [Chlamydia abortus]
MKFGLTRAGIGSIGSDEQWLQAAAEFGFQVIDGDPVGLVQRHGVQGAAELLARHQVTLGSFGLPVDWRTTDQAFREGLPKLLEAAEAAAALGCKSCCTYILPSTDDAPAPFMARAVKRLRLCAQWLGAYGIKLGLEYVGPHHLRTQWKHPFIWTQADTLALIEAIGEPNVGLLVDSFHWYTTELTYDDIAKLPAHLIVHVHINDAPPVPVEQVRDNERLYPGEGVIDLAAFLQALHKSGYQGAVTQEVLTKEPPQEDARALMERSRKALDRVLAAAGLDLLKNRL